MKSQFSVGDYNQEWDQQHLTLFLVQVQHFGQLKNNQSTFLLGQSVPQEPKNLPILSANSKKTPRLGLNLDSIS